MDRPEDQAPQEPPQEPEAPPSPEPETKPEPKPQPEPTTLQQMRAERASSWVGFDLPEDLPPAIASAIVVAQDAVQEAKKADFNAYSRYHYASVEEITRTAKAALTTAGLAVLPRGWRVQDLRWVHMRYLWVHRESGLSCTAALACMSIHPKSGQPFDKALAGALSMLHRETLRLLLNIPRATEEEPDRRQDGDIGY